MAYMHTFTQYKRVPPVWLDTHHSQMTVMTFFKIQRNLTGPGHTVEIVLNYIWEDIFRAKIWWIICFCLDEVHAVEFIPEQQRILRDQILVLDHEMSLLCREEYRALRKSLYTSRWDIKLSCDICRLVLSMLTCEPLFRCKDWRLW